MGRVVGHGMINGNASEFIDKMHYEDHYVVFNSEKYFVNGCQTKMDATGRILSVRLEVYNLTKNVTVFSETKPSASECVNAFEEAPIWNGKTFWEAESDIEWVDE